MNSHDGKEACQPTCLRPPGDASVIITEDIPSWSKLGDKHVVRNWLLATRPLSPARLGPSVRTLQPCLAWRLVQGTGHIFPFLTSFCSWPPSMVASNVTNDTEPLSIERGGGGGG